MLQNIIHGHRVNIVSRQTSRQPAGGDRSRKSSGPTPIGPDTFVTRCRDRLATTVSTTTGCLQKFVKSGTIKKNAKVQRETTEMRLSDGEEGSGGKKKQRGSIAKETVKIEGPADEPIPNENEKGVGLVV
ncbi:uncharacterized protein LOC114254871 [Monomorium pharaonis]|uniref:uncharacterized protein LOC114254871 n=1 Tax=Monomorium pharaonis TaxID=307658 RepID=UPI0017479BB1|nr:uncharacterized protein LOC114254871 [Monomorium pharaonis]